MINERLFCNLASDASEVELGMTLEQALSLQPDAVVLEADEPHYAREFEWTTTVQLLAAQVKSIR